ncbi:hypothetical protein DV515_00017556 [Chloebia gouldiae]|uniref:Ubiquitin-like domain-containing protein n=1 Tax=Chloebia gouldiae TaxID=44316 RepID=A0A3L8QAC9_CHLGU|nr:hypothetical protein DV515_00017561 [Chloebia gouldiae]RLV64132.1 hypothetical protein DV515_00017565 [Chloebia gouldiae]RLV64138.1 hypothetical protein DV515_00017552 [Chloebia gouldiae]RLV64142.1 hypothetical protein DV515_00017556 [Chloebia gouldiae]
MQLFIRGQTLLTLELSGSETLAQIKERVAELSGIPPEEQLLLHAGTPLDDEAVLGQSPLPEFTTLDLSTRLLGGKVHGSLARAGKVRGQTPKVSTEGAPPVGGGLGSLPGVWGPCQGFGDPPDTPIFNQVAKQEKKKKKTGRAKRRMQYNRRFVNVVPTFGKKKGPNANS